VRRVAMCELKSRVKIAKNTKKLKKLNTMVNNNKKMDCDEPHLVLNEKTQPIQWTKWPIGALVVDGSLWPSL